MFKTYKDILFWSLWALWLMCNLVSALVLNIDVVYVNFTWIILFCVLILVQSYSNKFSNWLMTPIK